MEAETLDRQLTVLVGDDGRGRVGLVQGVDLEHLLLALLDGLLVLVVLEVLKDA